MRTTATLLLLCLAGCHGVPTIRTAAGASVRGVADAGKAATLAQGEERSGFRIPAETRLTVTRTEGTATAPAVEVSEWLFAQPAAFERVASTLRADTGTVDTSVAKHRIDAAQRIYLLWAAIGCLILGVVVRSLVPAWPGVSNGLLIAAPLAFAAWKFAEVPAWLWATAVGVMALLALGYKRAEWDANRNGVPDVLERKPSPAAS